MIDYIDTTEPLMADTPRPPADESAQDSGHRQVAHRSACRRGAVPTRAKEFNARSARAEHQGSFCSSLFLLFYNLV